MRHVEIDVPVDDPARRMTTLWRLTKPKHGRDQERGHASSFAGTVTGLTGENLFVALAKTSLTR
jgi:hypothetical protein